jgi:hypothetical protein
MTVVPNPNPQPQSHTAHSTKRKCIQCLKTYSKPSFFRRKHNEPLRLFVGVLAYVLRRVWTMLQQSLRQDALPSLDEWNNTGHRWSYEYFFNIVQCMSCFEKASRCVSDYKCDV